MSKSLQVFLGGLFLISVLVPISSSNAGDVLLDMVDLHIDTPTLVKGYTVASDDSNFLVGIRPEVLAEETRVIIKHFDANTYSFPAELVPVSDVYEFDIFNKEAFQNKLPLMLKFNFSEAPTLFRQVYFYNGVIDEWVLLPTAYQDAMSVKGIIHLPYAKMVVLEDQKMSQGAASWYAYKHCNCAASPDYPKGTKLLVTNLYNNKSVEVVVNDYGPDRAIHPDRVIDLDKVAFSAIGEIWQGILSNVTVVPIKQ